jgi:Arc/MetJ family transcription regulator
MTKITTYIDDRLLKRALRASGARTKREVLESGLRTLVAEIQRNTFVREFDHLRLNLSPEGLAQSRL